MRRALFLVALAAALVLAGLYFTGILTSSLDPAEELDIVAGRLPLYDTTNSRVRVVSRYVETPPGNGEQPRPTARLTLSRVTDSPDFPDIITVDLFWNVDHWLIKQASLNGEAVEAPGALKHAMIDVMTELHKQPEPDAQ